MLPAFAAVITVATDFPDLVAVSDSKDPSGPALTFSASR
ncbi:DUF397 domain-containing protein [Streptosporangium sp. NPDC000239]